MHYILQNLQYASFFDNGDTVTIKYIMTIGIDGDSYGFNRIEGNTVNVAKSGSDINAIQQSMQQSALDFIAEHYPDT